MSKVSIYTPPNEEADRLLANVQKWVKELKALNVGADIAVYIARDFLCPIRMRPVDNDPSQADSQPSTNVVDAVSTIMVQPSEEQDEIHNRNRSR